MRFDVEVPGVAAVFAAIGGIVSDDVTRRAMDAAGLALENLIREGFDQSLAPDGTPWAKLTSRAGKPLRNTGATLLSTLTHITGVDSVEVGFGFRWAYVHQKGATIRPVKAKRLRFVVGGPGEARKVVHAREVKIPARPMIPERRLPDAWVDEVAGAVTRTIKAGAKKTG